MNVYMNVETIIYYNSKIHVIFISNYSWCEYVSISLCFKTSSFTTGKNTEINFHLKLKCFNFIKNKTKKIAKWKAKQMSLYNNNKNIEETVS